MSETVFVFLVTAALLLALRAYDAPSPLRVAASASVLGLAVLDPCRGRASSASSCSPGCSARGPGTRAALRRASVSPRSVSCVMAVVVVPWTIRNQQTFHEFVPVSNNLGTALAGANCRLDLLRPLARARGVRPSAPATPRAGQCFTGFNGSQPGFNEARAAADARHQGITYARDHLGDLPKVARRPARCAPSGVFRPGAADPARGARGATRSAGSGPARGSSGCSTRSRSPAPSCSSGAGPRSGPSRRRC